MVVPLHPPRLKQLPAEPKTLIHFAVNALCVFARDRDGNSYFGLFFSGVLTHASFSLCLLCPSPPVSL